MFGLALSRHIIQGPAVRTWNSITHFANLLWCKFNHSRNPIIMPRSRRYHSRSRSRSRSHSYDREREVKRRRIDSGDPSPYRRSLSLEDSTKDVTEDCTNDSKTLDAKLVPYKECKVILVDCADQVKHHLSLKPVDDYLSGTDTDIKQEDKQYVEFNSSIDSDAVDDKEAKTRKTISLSTKTPKKSLTPGQRKKLLERQKLRDAKLAEREQKKQQILEEKLKIKNEKEKERVEKQKIKQEKEEQRQKEKELKEEKKKKELEEKEQKRKEREEKDEQKRKEKEEKEEQKRKELEEKQKEKQKQEEKKQKVAAMFANFFTKLSDPVVEDTKSDDSLNTSFMPFKVKVDMKVAPLYRRILTESEKSNLIANLNNSNTLLYLEELKSGKSVGRTGKTWPFEGFENDDVIIVEDTEIGESIEDIPKTQKIRAKFFKFDENRRPPYFGTWRKRSKFINARTPFALDKEFFDYEIDSDEEWEEDDSGESLRGSDDEDKENDPENDYEVDNEFFVPHGHLSDDEINDEETAIESPEAHKAKLKLLKKEFDEEMKGQTHKIKPRVIGCVWEKKFGTAIDNAIYEFLKPFSVISNGPITIKKRTELILQVPLRKSGIPGKPLNPELVPSFLKFIHGSTNGMKLLINQFLSDLAIKGISTEVSKASLKQQTKQLAVWMRYPEEGPMQNKFCWYVNKDVQEKYNLDLSLSS